MRIACISTSRVPGISANSIQLMKVCEALTEAGQQVRLWVPAMGPPASWPDLAELYGLHAEFPVSRLSALPVLRRYDFCWRAVRAAARWQADLLYVWPLQAAALGSRLGRLTLLETHDRPRGRFGPWLFRQFLSGEGAVRLLVTTRALLADLEDGYDRQRVGSLAVLAPNGVDLARYQDLPTPAEARRRLSLPEAFTAVYSGHLYAGRGAELMYRLAGNNPDIEFVWAGGTEAAVARWRRRAEADGVRNLRLLGFVANARLPLVQAAGELLLMPYARRIAVSGGGDAAAYASPMKVFEYLAAGRAILSSDLPVLREVLDESTAELLPPEDERAWQAALRRLRTDPARCRQLADRARQLAQAHSWRRRAERALQEIGA